MLNDELSDLAIFTAVADARSFTRAAVKLGKSQSALSQSVRRLEEKPEAASTHAHHPQRDADACGRAALEQASPRSGRDRGSAQCAQRAARIALGIAPAQRRPACRS